MPVVFKVGVRNTGGRRYKIGPTPELPSNTMVEDQESDLSLLPGYCDFTRLVLRLIYKSLTGRVNQYRPFCEKTVVRMLPGDKNLCRDPLHKTLRKGIQDFCGYL